MKVLLVNGSPRKEGNMYYALTELEKRLHENGIETEIFWLGASVDGGCRCCGVCYKTGKCAFDNDKVNELCDKAAECDGFIFGTPVHYAAASGNITCALDRAFYSRGKNFSHKPAAAVATVRRGGASAALDQINKYFTINCMPVVSSTYWNIVHGRKPGEVMLDAEGLQTIRNLADNMTWLLKSIEAGKEKGIEIPTMQKDHMTNFVR